MWGCSRTVVYLGECSRPKVWNVGLDGETRQEVQICVRGEKVQTGGLPRRGRGGIYVLRIWMFSLFFGVGVWLGAVGGGLVTLCGVVRLVGGANPQAFYIPALEKEKRQKEKEAP